MRQWNADHPGYAAASVRRRREREPEVLRAAERAEYHRNRQEHRARILLNQAVRRGHIERGPCEVCGVVKVQAHHDDYAKPLDVRWLCAEHHRALHMSGRV